MSITMKDIAKMVGVSTNTVSRALNGKKEISEETRKRITEIAEELNYTPNRIAASLAAKKTKTIGLITSDIEDPFHARQARGIEDIAREHGYSVILFNTDENPESEIQAVNTFRSIRVAGIILNSIFPGFKHIEGLKKQNIPFVLLNRRLPDIDADYVINDNFNGAYEATKHLIHLGHTRIGMILGLQRVTSVWDRYAGFSKAMKEAGISINKDFILYGKNLKPETGKELTEQLLAMEPRPTAILAYCDTLAIGAYAAAHQMNLSIPKDLAIIGYDDILFSSYLEVPLTTLSQPAYKMGQAACNIILEKIKSNEEGVENKNLPKKHLTFQPQLVIRQSCGAYLRQNHDDI